MSNNLKGYDANQVLRSVYDVTKNTLRVSIVDGSTGGGDFEVVISHINDSIRLGNGTNYITSTTVGPKVGLDVAVVNEVNIEDLAATKDNVAIQDADGDELAINPDGSLTAVIIEPAAKATRIDEASASVLYVGLAEAGALPSAASWQIKRIETIGTETAIEFADGDVAFDNIWDDRASLTYV